MLARIHVSLLTKTAVKKVFVPDRLKASAATRLLLLLIFQCHNIAHARPCFLHFSHSPLLPARFASDKINKVTIWASLFRPEEDFQSGLSGWSQASNLSSSGHEATSHNTESPAAASWPVGNRAARPARGCYLHLYGGKQSYKALIIRGGERQRGIQKEREARCVGKRQGWRSIPCNGRQGQGQGNPTRAAQLHQPSPQPAPSCNFPQTSQEIANINKQIGDQPMNKQINKQTKQLFYANNLNMYHITHIIIRHHKPVPLHNQTGLATANQQTNKLQKGNNKQGKQQTNKN